MTQVETAASRPRAEECLKLRDKMERDRLTAWQAFETPQMHGNQTLLMPNRAEMLSCVTTSHILMHMKRR